MIEMQSTHNVVDEILRSCRARECNNHNWRGVFAGRRDSSQLGRNFSVPNAHIGFKFGITLCANILWPSEADGYAQLAPTPASCKQQHILTSVSVS
jgi:hypothetical protein